MEKNIKDEGIIVIPLLNMGGLDREERCIASGNQRGTGIVPPSEKHTERVGSCNNFKCGKGGKSNSFRCEFPFRETAKPRCNSGMRNSGMFQEIQAGGKF